MYLYDTIILTNFLVRSQKYEVFQCTISQYGAIVNFSQISKGSLSGRPRRPGFESGWPPKKTFFSNTFFRIFFVFLHK